MGDEINELKSVLRSLVVSSPTQMDVKTLMRDYRNMMGAPVPHCKYGHRNPVAFLQERFSDCFLFAGSPSNPVLTLIVPDTLKHIDQFVQRQRVPATAKFKLKRRSIPETIVNPPVHNFVSKTFVKRAPIIEEPKKPEDNFVSKTFVQRPLIIEEPKKPEVKAPDITNNTNHNKENVDDLNDSSNAVKNFLRKRMPLYNSLHNVDSTPSTSAEKDGTLSVSQDDDSGKHTSSTSNSTKALQFEELKSEIMELIAAAPQGVWCTDLIRLYRERYQRELNFTRFGYTSIVSLAYVLEARVQISRPVDTGDWLLVERRRAAAAPPRVSRACRAPPRSPAPADPDDALPGIDFDPDVFPEDCVHFMESIPTMSLTDCRPGAMLEVIVGEVYSPSHFWIIRLGEQYNIAMEDMMDDMTRYYNGPGRTRVLTRGAIRVGHFCSTLYDNDWHRSLIVKIVDSDTVKVRHVDYGTVDVVATSALRPLRREWAALPAQAARARLAAVRPSAAGRRWPHAAAAHFLRLVRDTRLVANVVAVDLEEGVVETLLIDTSGAADLCVSHELVRAGHADPRPDSALQTAECYLYPRFEALESGDTPNYAEIHAYLRDGIALDYVDAYRRHVPMCLPPARPAPPSPAPSPPPSPPPDAELATRIPLLWPSASPPAPTAPSPTTSDPSVLSSPCPSPEPPPRPVSTPRTLPATNRSPTVPPKLSASAQPFCPQLACPRPPAMFHPPGMYPLPPIYPPPPGAHPLGQWFGPYPAPGGTFPAPGATYTAPGATFPAPGATYPAPSATYPTPGTTYPAPAATYPTPGTTLTAPGATYPLPGAGPFGGVTLSMDECEMYHMLVRFNPAAAHKYMAGALGRAMGAPRPAGPPHGPPHGMLAPPGFGG